MTKFKISFGVMIFQFVTQVLSVLFIIIKIRDISLISAKLVNHFFIYAYKQLAFSSLLKTLSQAPRSHLQDFQCPLLLGSSQSVFQSLSWGVCMLAHWEDSLFSPCHCKCNWHNKFCPNPKCCDSLSFRDMSGWDIGQKWQKKTKDLICFIVIKLIQPICDKNMSLSGHWDNPTFNSSFRDIRFSKTLTTKTL